MVSYEKTMAYLYIYAPEGGAVGPGGEGRGQRVSQRRQWKHTDAVMVSEQRCLLHCYCLTLRSQPVNMVPAGVAGISCRPASISTSKAGVLITGNLLVKY